MKSPPRAAPARASRPGHRRPSVPSQPPAACPPELARAGAQAPSGAPPSSPAGVPEEQDRSVVLLAKALGHPARVKILRVLLARGECVCGALVETLPLAQATVSQHLKVLKAAGFIRGTIQGPRTCYAANPGRLEEFRALLDRF